MIDEKREYRKSIVAELAMNGFEFPHRFDNGEPMLRGGYEYSARRDDYILAYDINDKVITVQKYYGGFEDIDRSKPLIMEFEPIDDLRHLHIFLLKKGLRFKENR